MEQNNLDFYRKLVRKQQAELDRLLAAEEADHVMKRVLELTAMHDCHHSVFWHADLKMFALCNDLFWWATADGEQITIETLPIFERSLIEAEEFGPELYCCRVRKMRPQGAYYQHLDKELWPLFDECGPERAVGIGNPKERPNGSAITGSPIGESSA